MIKKHKNRKKETKATKCRKETTSKINEATNRKRKREERGRKQTTEEAENRKPKTETTTKARELGLTQQPKPDSKADGQEGGVESGREAAAREIEPKQTCERQSPPQVAPIDLLKARGRTGYQRQYLHVLVREREGAQQQFAGVFWGFKESRNSQEKESKRQKNYN